MTNAPQRPKLRFSLRGMMIVTAWASCLLAIAASLKAREIVSAEAALYLAWVLLGALLGTLYGVLRNRPEQYRLLRVFRFAVLFGVLPCVPAIVSGWDDPGPVGILLLALVLSVPTAAAAATLTELLRELVQRFG